MLLVAAIGRIAPHPMALLRNIKAIVQSSLLTSAYAIGEACDTRKSPQVLNEIASAPDPSLAAFAICGM
jgi:hypothetical protein